MGDVVTRTVAGIHRALEGERATSPRAVLVVMCVDYFLVLLDVAILNVALPSIASGIGTSPPSRPGRPFSS